MSQLRSSADAADYAQAVLTGERVRLRGLRSDDLEPLSRWQLDPSTLSTLQRWLCPPSAASAQQSLTDLSANQSLDVGFVIETRWRPEARPELLGHIYTFGLSGQNRCAGIGVYLAPQFAGQGYGSDAVRTMAGYLFREVGLHRVELTVSEYNTIGIRSYIRAGFVEEGRRRRSLFRDGDWYDEVVMSMLFEDWAAQRSVAP